MKRPIDKKEKPKQKDAVSSIRQAITKRGGRMGKARAEVIAALEASRQPRSIQELANMVHVDEVSIYRTINFLMQTGFLEEILLSDNSRVYTLATHHHDHAVCTTCGYVAHVPCSKILASSSVSGFKTIERHTLTYYGMCSTCAR